MEKTQSNADDSLDFLDLGKGLDEWILQKSKKYSPLLISYCLLQQGAAIALLNAPDIKSGKEIAEFQFNKGMDILLRSFNNDTERLENNGKEPNKL